MSDPTALNEILKQVTEAYRVFSMELRAVQVKKADLVKAILARYPGDKAVYLSVGGKRIKTSFAVAMAPEMFTELEAVIGRGKLKY